MVAGVRIALEIAGAARAEAITRETFSVPASDSDEDILDWARARRARPSTTRPRRARWAPSSTPSSRLRGRRPACRGRVGDADITRANTNAPTMMIAEKAADLILGRVPLGSPSGSDGGGPRSGVASTRSARWT